MSNLVIVAIPDENDRVWRVSSEKVPHLTLLYLGEASELDNVEQIVRFVEHAATQTLRRFHLPVDRRGELGDGKADVLFFKRNRYDFKAIRDFRVQLLKDHNIRTAHDSNEQHEGPWNPHLTLGYPDSPAKPAKEEYDDSFYGVEFTKIAVWLDEYDGPEFILKDYWDDDYELEPGMAQPSIHTDSTAAEEFMLSHYGVKGMKWGVRKTHGIDGTGETKKSRWDPEGHALGGIRGDAVKSLILGSVPVIGFLAVPAQVRVLRGASRTIESKLEDSKEKRGEKKLAKEDAKFEKVAQSQAAFVAIHNGASDRVNRDIGNINKKYTEADLANPAKRKAYDNEIQKSMQDAYRESANQIGNKSGTKHLDVEFRNDGNDFAIKVRDGQQKPTAARVLDIPDNVSSTTKRVMKDHNDLSDSEFKSKYAVGKETYAKRVDKYGDPYMNAPAAKIGKKLSRAKHSDEVGGLDENALYHASIDHDDVVTFMGKLLRNQGGHILDLDFEDFGNDLPKKSEMAQAAEDGAEFMVFNGLMDPGEFLEHFGVKGMRWGVRKEDIQSVGRAAASTAGKVDKFVRDVNFEAKLDDPAKKVAIETEIKNKAKQAFHRTDLPAIKDKPEYQAAKKLRNRLRHPKDPATKAYRKEVKDAYISRLEDAANSMTNASGTRQYTIRERGWETPPEGGALPKSKYYWDVSSREVKHADGDEITWTMEVSLDEDGFVSGIDEVSTANSMAQSMEDGAYFLAALGVIGEDELEHYGVKGMQWGVRRNRDAPLAVTPVSRSRVPHGDKRKTKVDVEGGQNHEAAPDALKVAEHKAKLKKSGVHALSNQELRELNQRLQLETQAAQLTSSRANKFIQRQLEQQGQQVVQTGARKAVKRGAKKAGKAAATGAVTLALL